MYVADTHTWVYYLLNRLTPASNKIFASVENGNDVIFVPTIALSECVHLIGKNKLILTYDGLFSRFDESNNFIVAPLTLEITKYIPKIDLKELHDKMIVATARINKAKLISKDEGIIKSELVDTIWN